MTHLDDDDNRKQQMQLMNNTAIGNRSEPNSSANTQKQSKRNQNGSFKYKQSGYTTGSKFNFNRHHLIYNNGSPIVKYIYNKKINDCQK